jgi:hypothetical protein
MKLLNRVVEVARMRRLSANTIDAYSGWIKGFLSFRRRGLGGTRKSWAPMTSNGSSTIW